MQMIVNKKMVKSKISLAICFCLIAVLAGFSAWSYVGAEELGSKVNDLESKISDLETDNAELETQNAELQSKVNDSESRASELLLIVGYPDDLQSVSFMIMHMGTEEVTISEIRVDGVLNSSSPGWVGNGTLLPGQMGEITLYGSKYFADGFADGGSYEFWFVTARENSFYCVVLFEGLTIMPTEQLAIQGCTFKGTSGDAANTIVLTVQNVGTVDSIVDRYKVGGGGTVHDIPDVLIAQGTSASVTLTTGADGEAWTSGTTYDIYLITATGKQFAYRATAP